MPNSSDKFHDAKVPDWEIFGLQYLHVGCVPYVAKLREEFYGACCAAGIFWSSCGVLRSFFHIDYLYVVSGNYEEGPPWM
jgi:hypothetical protein